jgi:hypothetical protein
MRRLLLRMNQGPKIAKAPGGDPLFNLMGLEKVESAGLELTRDRGLSKLEGICRHQLTMMTKKMKSVAQGTWEVIFNNLQTAVQ